MKKLPQGVRRIIGNKSGKTAAIIVGTHGNEVAGLRAMKALERKGIKIDRGVLYIIRGNPRAIAKNVRYVDENLNRSFIKGRRTGSGCEFKRAQKLKPILQRCDIVLDIHTTSIKDSRPFIIAEANSEHITKLLPAKIVCRGFDRVEPGGIDYFMNSIGKIGICFESGYLNSPSAKKTTLQSISIFLKAVGMLVGSVKLRKQLMLRVYYLHRTRTDRFKLVRQFRNFEQMHRNQVIGYDGTRAIRAPRRSHIIFAHNRDRIGEEAFLLAEKKGSPA